jgi:putative endonuclease
MFDRIYFVYILQSTSRHTLYIGFTNFLIARVIEHRTRKHPNSFSAKYRTWRLVYYEEFGDSSAAFTRERQLKGWSRAKKEWLITLINPHWHDLISKWEEKYGLEFHLDGRITSNLDRAGWASKVKTKDPSTTEDSR